MFRHTPPPCSVLGMVPVFSYLFLKQIGGIWWSGTPTLGNLVVSLVKCAVVIYLSTVGSFDGRTWVAVSYGVVVMHVNPWAVEVMLALSWGGGG